MLLIKTKIGPSPIVGIGLFADEFIPKGTKIWELVEGFDVRFGESILERLSPPAKAQFLKYAYHMAKSPFYVLCGDDARHMNHACNPNTKYEYPPSSGEDGVTVAAKDIQLGEEITCDYSFDPRYKDINSI